MAAARRRHLRACAVAMFIAAAGAACSEHPVTLKQATYADESTTTTSSEPPPSTTAFQYIPYVPDETTTTTGVPRTSRAPRSTTSAAPRPSTTRAPRTTQAPRPSSSRAPRTPTTAGAPSTPSSIRIRVEVLIGGTWAGPVGTRCKPTATVHPELVNAKATITDANGTVLSSGVIYAGHIAQPAGASGFVCDMGLHLSSVTYGPTYTMTIEGQPPVTLTSQQLVANGGVFVLTVG